MIRNLLLVSISLFLFGSVRSQTVSYISPDAAAPGMSVVVEFIGPNTFNNFGEDGFNKAQIQFLNPSDSERIILGPSVTSWNGRMVSAMLFLNDSVKTGAIPMRLSVQGQASSVDTFFIVAPQHVGALTATGALGSGGRFGVRSKRNVLVVDSLIVGPGPTTISPNDPDPLTPGNQAFLPFTILSKGPVRITGRLSVSANGINGVAGGGGGGGARPIIGGNGFTGGGGTERIGGIGSGGEPDATNQGAGSLNGVTGGVGCIPDDQGGGGGTGFPFGSSGLNGTWYANGGVSNPGGYGGASAGGEHSNLDTSYGGGGGGFATDGKTGSFNGDNHGHSYGNPMVVPFCGGSGGGAANTYGQGTPGSGGGGGGAINLVSYDELYIEAPVEANGSDGVSSYSGYAGGGGAGSGGAIELTGQDLIFITDSLSAIGGQGGTAVYALDGGGMRGGDGGGGAVRINGQVITSGVTIRDGGSYLGPTVKKCVASNFESSTLEGTGEPGDSIYIYYRTDVHGWNYSRPIRTIVHPDSIWEYPFGLPYRVRTYVATLQKDQLVIDSMHYRPEWVMSHTSGAILCRTASSGVSSNAAKSGEGLKVSARVNSTRNLSTLFITGLAGSAASITVTDLLGREIEVRTLSLTGNSQLTFKPGELHPGVYVYRVTAEGQTVSGKLMIGE